MNWEEIRQHAQLAMAAGLRVWVSTKDKEKVLCRIEELNETRHSVILNINGKRVEIDQNVIESLQVCQ